MLFHSDFIVNSWTFIKQPLLGYFLVAALWTTFIEMEDISTEFPAAITPEKDLSLSFFLLIYSMPLGFQQDNSLQSYIYII